MATCTQYHLASSNRDLHAPDSIKVALGRIKSEWGNLSFLIRSSPMGKSHVDVCMAVLDGTNTKSLSVTLQLDVTVHSDRMSLTSRGGGIPGSKAVTLGPVTKALPSTLCTAGSIVSVALAIPYLDPKLVIEQLIVNISTATEASAAIPYTMRSAVPLFLSINQPHLCDCLLELADNLTLHASRAILAHASPNFFGTKFKRPEWNPQPPPENSPTGGADAHIHVPTVKLEAWSIKSVLPCLANMYFGWLPATDKVLSVAALGASQGPPLSVDTAAYALMDWNEVLELAQMLELTELVAGVKEAMIAVLRKK